jgi:ketosteroid isomerase-like protein
VSRTGLFVGAAAAVGARAVLPQLLLAKLRRDVSALNRGDRSALLRAYAKDAVLRFDEGDHRWAGDWVGRENIDRFLRNFTAARMQGTITGIALRGRPWALTVFVRFDDHADAPDGTRLYENRTVLVLRTRWAKVVHHEDFYADTRRIEEFDRRLTALGVGAIPKVG